MTVPNRSVPTRLSVVGKLIYSNEDSHLIYFAHGNDRVRPVIAEMLKALGHRVDLVTKSGRELMAAVEENQPDLLISSVTLSDMNGIDALIKCSEIEPIPAIIISTLTDQERVEHALQDHVMAYLAEPVQQSDLRPAIFLVLARFEQFQELRKENQELKEALANRKWVEKAKGLLMKKQDLDENQAYRKLQRMASDKRSKLGEIAKTLVEADELLNSGSPDSGSPNNGSPNSDD